MHFTYFFEMGNDILMHTNFAASSLFVFEQAYKYHIDYEMKIDFEELHH